MKILYIITLVSFTALAWAILAIMRHIRKGAAVKANPVPQADLSLELDDRLKEIARHFEDGGREQRQEDPASRSGSVPVRPEQILPVSGHPAQRPVEDL